MSTHYVPLSANIHFLRIDKLQRYSFKSTIPSDIIVFLVQVQILYISPDGTLVVIFYIFCLRAQEKAVSKKGVTFLLDWGSTLQTEVESNELH